MQKELNPKFWKNNKLIPDVKDTLLKISNEFMSRLPIKVSVADIIIVGSNASYNYKATSDLDLHIVLNFSLLKCDKEILQALFNKCKTEFNNDLDITIKGTHVEVYVEDIMSSTISNGIYSVLNDEWIIIPDKNKIKDLGYESVAKYIKQYENQIDAFINSKEAEEKENINIIINRIYLMRRNSLSIDGEYGKGNLIFKKLRDDGYIEKLYDILNNVTSKELTLENYSSLNDLFLDLDRG